jgi:putative copper export protein
MNFDQLLQLIEATALATLVREGDWWFPLAECLHVLAITTVFGSILMMDLRLLGRASRDSAVSQLSSEVLPYTWFAFGCAAITGAIMFISRATTYGHNTPFQLKMVFLALAGANMLFFHFGAFRRVAEWDSAPTPPAAARLAGALSISLWIAVVVFGRWIGFTT